ncbi:chromodomain-helicase-DNA-binding protein [Striga asiatica]|uniref:Chromodomain-helicase-DNA-binding protein n=1 Tax=Striga asiatica TaxID=4170 RepID=A0A5A7QNM6_STRAF|nr:chromodomain-helicase-DNA-binding protein [Striga asiatica]
MALCASKSKKLNGHGYKKWLKSQGIKAKNNTENSEKQGSPCNMDKSEVKKEPESENCNAHMSKTTKPNFVEYWVPVSLSEMQTELYCGTLFSNEVILTSHSKNESRGAALNDMLIWTRKCCDHPYLVDGSLSTSLIGDVAKPELLDAEIKLSNKLMLLHKILLEIRKRWLRVLILYQFGPDLYEHIGGRRRVPTSKRQASLNTFNNKDNGKFVCLMETDSCTPSIKIASVDTVIFFNSDWNPANDLKALQKIDLDSQLEHVKVFRLYSSHTMEEKLLILAKQGMAPEGIVMDISQRMCHQLLTWGASHLFEKLDEFHNFSSSDDDENSAVFSSEDPFGDVLLELSSLWPHDEKSNICGKRNSLIVEVRQMDGIYPGNMSLVGELENPQEMIPKKFHLFWKTLLKGRNPKWKYFSSQSRRTSKAVKMFYDVLEESARTEPSSRKRRKEEASAQTKPAPTKRRRKARNALYQFPTIIKRKIRTKLRNRETDKRRKVSSWVNLQIPPLGRAPPSEHHSLPRADERRTTQKDGNPHGTAIVPQSVCKALQMELEVLQKEKIDLLKLHEEKKLQSKMACEKEIEEIRKKYDALLQNAEAALLEEKGVLEAKYKKVETHKSLAEAVMQTDILFSRAIAEVTSNCSDDEMYKLFHQWTRSKPPRCSEAEGPIQESLPSKPEAFQSPPNLIISSEVASSLPIKQSLGTTNFQASLLAAGPNQPLPDPGLMSPCSTLTPMVHIPRTLVGGQVSPAPHFRHMWPPQPIVPPGLLPFSSAGIVSPVSLPPLTSHVLGLQSTISSFWASSPFDRLPL